MANIRPTEKIERLRTDILLAAAKLFLAHGYSNTSVREIAKAAGISANKIFYEMKNKEEILCELVRYVLEGQFAATEKLLAGKTQDKVLFYAAETTLQLYMAESSENVRELYAAAYSMPRSMEAIQHVITEKLENIFHDHLPDLETKDFYELEIASGGIMRGFMTVPCDMYFTMERKVHRFLETTFLIYRMPREKILEAVEFVSQFDYPTIAQKTIEDLMIYLERQLE